jgi:predicted nucleic acid-binding protein
MVDTHVLIWAIKERANDAQKHKVKHAQYLLHQLDKQGAQTVISTIVVSELLRDVEIDKQKEMYMVLQKNFLIMPFCNRAALECARIAKIHDLKNPKEDLKDTHSNTAMKSDWMILATALVNNVQVLYTEDKPLTNMAKLVEEKITVVPIPEPVQEDIFDPFFY